MADFPKIPFWDGSYWYWRHGYDNLDPFQRPIPAPVAGIFDNSGGDMRTVCFNPAWSPILTGALSRLTVSELYLSDGEETVQDVLKFMNLIAGIGDNPCAPQSITETQCAYYPSWYAGIEYIPHNPFNPSGTFDPLYPVAPFFRFANIDTVLPDWLENFFQSSIENVTGYLENDVFVSYLSVPTVQNPFDGLDYPTIKITVQGSGKLSLHLLAVPAGGRALVSIGDTVGIDDIFTALWSKDDRILELNRDIFATVPETDVDVIEEIFLETDGTHEIYIMFLPVVNDETPFLQYGGGFRGYELCGNLTVIDPASGETIDFTNKEISLQEGVILTTYDDLLKALNDHQTIISQAWLLALDSDNIRSDVTIDKDSKQVTLGQSGLISKELPTDITSLQKNSGAATFQAKQFNLLFENMNGWITDGFALTTIQNLVRAYLQPDDPGAVDTLVTAYVNATPAFNISLNVANLAEDIYSSGDFFSGVYNHALDQTEVVLNEVIAWAGHTGNVLRDWFDKGYEAPNDDYLGYDVTLRDSFTVNIANVSTVQVGIPVPAWAFSNPRRIRISVSGKITRISTGEYVDGAFRYNSSGVIQSDAFNVLTLSGAVYPLDAPENFAPDANGDGAYIVEVASGTGTFSYKNPVDWSGDETGSITFTIEDLGVV